MIPKAFWESAFQTVGWAHPALIALMLPAASHSSQTFTCLPLPCQDNKFVHCPRLSCLKLPSEAQQLAQHRFTNTGHVPDPSTSVARSRAQRQPGDPCLQDQISIHELTHASHSSEVYFHTAETFQSIILVFTPFHLFFFYMYDVHTCVICGHICVCMYTWKPEAYTKVLPGFLSDSLIEAGSLTGPRACWFGCSSQPACLRDSHLHLQNAGFTGAIP